MLNIRRYVPYLILAFAAWCLISLRADLVQLPLAAVLRSWDVVAVAALLSLVNYLLRIWRWRIYLQRFGHKLPLRFAALTFVSGFAYTLSPGKLGEMVRARYYGPLQIPLSQVAAAFFCERFLDLVAMVALAALLFGSDSGYANQIAGGGAGALVILIAVALLPWSQIAARLNSKHGQPGKVAAALARIANTLACSRVLLSPGMLAAGFALGLGAWSLEGVGLAVLSSMFQPPHLDLTGAIAVYAVAVLIGGLSFLPGGLGSTEAVMTALLTAHHYSVSEALLITLTCRLVTLWLGVAVGWVAVLVLRQRSFAPVVPCK